MFVVCDRIENLDKKEYFDVIVSRALADLKVLLKYSEPFLKKNGYLIAYKGKNYKTELDNIKKISNNLKMIDLIKYEIDDKERYLLVLKKMK